MECMFQILLENHTVHVKLWYKDAGLEMGSQTSTTALGENCTNLTSTGMHAANMKSCGCAVLVTAMNLTGTVNGTQGTVPSKRHRFRFHGGDEWAEKNAIYDQCSPPLPSCTISPKIIPGTGGAGPAQPFWQMRTTTELLGHQVLEIGPVTSSSCGMSAEC